MARQVYVLHDLHGDGEVIGIITSKILAEKWKTIDPEYRLVVPSEINSPDIIARINQESVDRKLLANAEKALAKGG
jgi:hypothetical protein